MLKYEAKNHYYFFSCLEFEKILILDLIVFFFVNLTFTFRVFELYVVWSKLFEALLLAEGNKGHCWHVDFGEATTKHGSVMQGC